MTLTSLAIQSNYMGNLHPLAVDATMHERIQSVKYYI